MVSKYSFCLIGNVCLVSVVLVYACLTVSCRESLVEGAHSLSSSWRPQLRWHMKHWLHVSFISSSLHCLQFSTPALPCSTVSSFPPLVLPPFYVLFWLSLNRVFSVPVCLSVCLCPCDVCSGLLSDTPPLESGKEFNLWPFLLGFCRSPSGGPEMGWFSFCLNPVFFSRLCDGGCWTGPPITSRLHGAIATWSGSLIFPCLCFLLLLMPYLMTPVVPLVPACMDACMQPALVGAANLVSWWTL